MLLRLSRLEGLVGRIGEARGGGDGGEEELVGQREVGRREGEDEMIGGLEVAWGAGVSGGDERRDGGHGNGKVSEFAEHIKKQDHWTRRSNSSFWKNLGDEIHGLRQLLEEPMDDGDEEDHLTESTLSKNSPPYILL